MNDELGNVWKKMSLNAFPAFEGTTKNPVRTAAVSAENRNHDLSNTRVSTTTLRFTVCNSTTTITESTSKLPVKNDGKI
jgi:hypothetical protein